MEAVTSILKKTCPSNLRQNKALLESVLKDSDPSALQTFRQENPLSSVPFYAIDLSEEGDDEKPYLQSNFNRIETHPATKQAVQAYRSPWTHKYYFLDKKNGEKLENFTMTGLSTDEQEVREMESVANEVWEAYTQLYYGMESIGSVYLHPAPKAVMAGMFGIHKRDRIYNDKKGNSPPKETSEEEQNKIAWDSSHIVHVTEDTSIPSSSTGNKGKPKVSTSFIYRVESAVVVVLEDHPTKISASLTKEVTRTCKIRLSNVVGSHLENLGVIMEEIEMEFRSKMERVEVPKALDVVDSMSRKGGKSGTVHLIQDLQSGIDALDVTESPVVPSGMGVGKMMIGEIALKAKSKKEAGGDVVVKAVEESKKAKEEEQQKQKEAVHSPYGNMKQGLKSTASSVIDAVGTPPATPLPAGSTDSAKQEYSDLRAGLRKTAQVPKESIAPPFSPSPEFVNFRNKLKKTKK